MYVQVTACVAVLRLIHREDDVRVVAFVDVDAAADEGVGGAFVGDAQRTLAQRTFVPGSAPLQLSVALVNAVPALASPGSAGADSDATSAQARNAGSAVGADDGIRRRAS